MAKDPIQPEGQKPPPPLLVDPAKHAEFLQKVQDWAGPIIKDKKCVKCGNGSWIIPSDIVQIFPHTGGGLRIGGPVYPFMLLVCNGCGYTEFYNAVVAGFIVKTPPSEKSKEE